MGELVAVEVEQVAPAETPRLRVAATSARDLPGMQAAVSSALSRLLGLDVDLAAFYQFAADDAQLGPLAERFRGFKPPRYPSVFEALLNAVASQQVTLNLAIQLLDRLAAEYGAAIDDLRALPQPQALAHEEPEALRKLGFSGQKARTIVELAGAQLEGRLDDSAIAALDDEAALSYLRQFRGVGRWTAEYVLLRGLGRLHIFPGNDSGARNGVRRWRGLTDPLDDAGVERTFARWRPYAGLLYLHLLLRGLAETQKVGI
jgi:DNA-3-methyladenine glycosylase II